MVAASNCLAAAPRGFIEPGPVTWINDGFWSPRLGLWRTVTANDVLDKLECWVANFDRVARGEKSHHDGPSFADGHVTQTIRGIADHLRYSPDPQLQKRIESVADRIVAASDASPDGYLQTQTILMFPERRWGDNGGSPLEQHELYNAGCLVEAAVHLYRSTGHLPLLKAATRVANLFTDVMGPPPKRNLVPTHELPEEAFLKLWKLYADEPGLAERVGVAARPEAYRDLVFFWNDHRGTYGDPPRRSWGRYDQDLEPVSRQETIEGHAVRAALMGVGLSASVLAGREDYRQHAIRLWRNMTGRKMYVTGAIGSIPQGEKFGPDWHLPPDSYLETCASVANAIWSAYLVRLEDDGVYADNVERVLYNALLTAVGQTGNVYTYVNPLNTSHHCRWRWHDCPCCPPMFLKLTGLLPELVWHQKPGTLYSDLYVGGETAFDLPDGHSVTVRTKTAYPWDGSVRYTVLGDAEFTLAIRIPGWARAAENPWGLYRSNLPARHSLKVNGQPVEAVLDKGYARLKRQWKRGDAVELELPMDVRAIAADPNCADMEGCVCLARGPVVYAFESVDQPALAAFTLNTDARFALRRMEGLSSGVTALVADGLTAVPYFSVANRAESTRFRVWVPAHDALAATASHVFSNDRVDAVVDGIVPTESEKISGDSIVPHHSFWPHKGTREWLEVRLPFPRRLSGVDIWWYCDTPKGGCDMPKSWKVLSRSGDGADWREVAAGAESVRGEFQRIAFKEPIDADRVRLEVVLKEDKSAGLHEIHLLSGK